MEAIKFKLDKYHLLAPPDAELKKAIIRAIKEVVGVELPESSISFQHKTAFIRAKPVLKSELLIHQKEISDSLAMVLSHPPRRLV